MEPDSIKILLGELKEFLDKKDFATSPSDGVSGFVRGLLNRLIALKKQLATVAPIEEKVKGVVHTISPLSNPSLSLLRTALEVALAFGINPYIGNLKSPESPSAPLQMASPEGQGHTVRWRLDHGANDWPLFLTSASNLCFLLNDKAFYDLLVPARLLELLAALITLGFNPSVPVAKKEDDNTSDAIVDSISLSERENARKMLNFMLNKVDTADMVSALLLAIRLTDQSWLQKRCSVLLSSLLTRPQALRPCLMPILDQEHASDADYSRVAVLVTTVPQGWQTEPFYALIAPQLRECLVLKGESHLERGYIQSALLAIGRVVDESLDLARDYFIRPLMDPLRCLRAQGPVSGIQNVESSNSVIVTEKTLDQLVTALALLLVSQSSPRLASLLVDDSIAFLGLWQLYCFTATRARMSRVTAKVSEILDTILQALRKETAARTIQQLIAHPLAKDAQGTQSAPTNTVLIQETNNQPILPLSSHPLMAFASMHQRTGSTLTESTDASVSRVILATGPTGGIEIKRTESNQDSNLINPLLRASELTDPCQPDESLPLVELLHRTRHHLCLVHGPDFLMSTLVEIMGSVMQLSQSENDRNIKESLLQTMTFILDKFGDELFQNSSILLTLIGLVLQPLSSSVSRTGAASLDAGVLALVITILDTLISGGNLKLTAADEFLLFDLVPALERIACIDTLQVKATELKETICRRDPNWRVSGESNLKEKPSLEADEIALRQSLASLNDPFLCARTHALITLRELVLSKAPCALKEIPNLLAHFQTQLTSDDDSVYLAAIAGLTALADVALDATLPILASVFLNRSNCEGSNSSKGVVNEMVRLKCGEALTKIVTRLGELLPFHASAFWPIFFLGVRDTDHVLIQVSSLVNMAFLSRLVGYSLQAEMVELIDCLQAILTNPKQDVLVVRGALVLVQELLEGLGSQRISAILSLSQMTALNELLFMHATSLAPLNNSAAVRESKSTDEVNDLNNHELTRALAQDALVTLQEATEAMVQAAAHGEGDGESGRHELREIRSVRARSERKRIEKALKLI